MLTQFKLNYLGNANVLHHSNSFLKAILFLKRGKCIAQSPVSLSEAFKLSNELQINLTQHWCASTCSFNVLRGWLDGSGS